MGESVVRAMESGSRPVVQVVGRFHVEHDGGLAQAIRKMRPGTRIVSVVYVGVERAPVVMKDEERGRADYVMYVGPVEDTDGKP